MICDICNVYSTLEGALSPLYPLQEWNINTNTVRTILKAFQVVSMVMMYTLVYEVELWRIKVKVHNLAACFMTPKECSLLCAFVY